MNLSVGLVWSGLVGSQMKSVGRVVQIRNDTTRPDKRQSLVGPVPSQVPLQGRGPDPTRPDRVRGLVGDARGPNGLCLRQSLAGLVEFGQ